MRNLFLNWFRISFFGMLLPSQDKTRVSFSLSMDERKFEELEIYHVNSETSILTQLKQRLFLFNAASNYGTNVIATEPEDFTYLFEMDWDVCAEFFNSEQTSSYLQIDWDRTSTDIIANIRSLKEVLQVASFDVDFDQVQQTSSLAYTASTLTTDASKLLTHIVEAKMARLLAEEKRREEIIPFVHEFLSDKEIEEKITSSRNAAISTLSGSWLTAYQLAHRKEEAIATAPLHVNAASWQQFLGIGEEGFILDTGLRLIEPAEDGDLWELSVLLRYAENHFSEEWFWNPTERIPARLRHHRHMVDNTISQWLHIAPYLKDEATGYLKESLTEAEAWQFLTETADIFLRYRIPILLPQWWSDLRRTRPRLKAVLLDKSVPKQSFFKMDTLVQFDWRMSIGNTEISEEQFQQLVNAKRRLIQIDGQWMALDPKLVKKLQQFMTKAEKEGITIRDCITSYLEKELAETDTNEQADDIPVTDIGAADGLETSSVDGAFFYEGFGAETDERMVIDPSIEISGTSTFQSWMESWRNVQDTPLLTPPISFNGTLRPYQLHGMSWLVKMFHLGLGAILADDMGLGKTAQTISYLLKIKEENADAYDAPALVVAPTSVIGNWARELEQFSPSLRVYMHYGSNRLHGEDFVTVVKDYDVVITTYALTHLDEADLEQITWVSLILDEAQNIKNDQTLQSQAIRKLPSKHRLALSGTPIENRLTELWALFDFINSGYLGTRYRFHSEFIQPIEKDLQSVHTKRLKALISPFFLRRTKKDKEVQLNLPEKQEQKEFCNLTNEQATLYEAYVKETFAGIEKLNGFERRGKVLQMLLKLKQLCDHPGLFLKEDYPDNLIERSLKLQHCLELVENILSCNEQVIIFTQYRKMGEWISRAITETFGVPALFLNGSVSQANREVMIASFQNGEVPVFILSLKAGGTGLNLTAANHVIHYDRWWNPAVKNQATDRAYRIGQTRFVHVHKLILLGTLEERIDQLLQQKEALSSELISSDKWVTELDDTELRKLIFLR